MDRRSKSVCLTICRRKSSIRMLIQVFITIFALVIISVPSPADAQSRRSNIRQREKQLLDQLLGDKYDTKIRPDVPANSSGETQVTVNLWLRSVSKIDDFNMEYSVQLTMREEWYDDRLRYEQFRAGPSAATFPPYLTVTDTNRVWMPDIFFINEKQGHLHQLVKPNAYVRIYPDGTVQFSIRISLVLSCPMFLHYFPMDRQKCSILMASYGLTNEDLVFTWEHKEPVQLPNLTLPRFALEEVRTDEYDRVTGSGKYSTLQVDLILRRNFSYYMTQMFIPCIMLVIVSQVSFFIDENAAPARTALGITTLLTMATQSASINTKLPPVSYNKAIDVWTSGCILFVFGALIEFAFVNYCSRIDKRMKAKWQAEHGPIPQVAGGWLSRRYPSRSKRIDVISRIVFPLLFLLFNIAYWSICLTADDNVDNSQFQSAECSKCRIAKFDDGYISGGWSPPRSE